MEVNKKDFQKMFKKSINGFSDQLFQLMSQINASVKASEYNNQLANQIFSLCQHLKSNGQQLEQTHKCKLFYDCFENKY